MPTYRFAQVFVDVDTQFDFLDPSGRLYVPGSTAIVPRLTELSRYAESRQIPVLASACAHGEDDAEFAQFPPHCVADTPGQLKLAGTLLRRRVTLPAGPLAESLVGAGAGAEPELWLSRVGQIIVQKTAFDVFSNPLADRLVRAVEADRFVVYGVATDYCVKAWVEGLLARGKRVVLVRDAIAAVAPAVGEETIADFCRRGAATATTAEIVAG